MARTSQRARNLPGATAHAALPGRAPFAASDAAGAPAPPAPTWAPVAGDAGEAAADRIGIVFVHGIGSQKPADTFLDWSGPIVSLLSDWRLQEGLGVDPVHRGAFNFTGEPQPFLELAIPAVHGHQAQTWVVTESWWAALLRAPGLDSMTTYARKGLPEIIKGIKAGYELREASWRQRREDAVAEAAACMSEPGTAADRRAEARFVLAELAPKPTWAWIDVLDRIQKNLSSAFALPALALGTLVLLVYAPFRHLPITALREAAILTSADNFLTTWLGDLPDILDDPVQAANVRARLAETIEGLRSQGCDRIVVVAHSGGAIVSFTTLVDPAYGSIEVDKLVTLGEGLQLAWRLECVNGALPDGSRLRGDLRAARPNMRWVDFWGTYDPAPGGPLKPLDGDQVQLVVDTRAVTNRMSIVEDHGGYWENDEGFLIALLRELDTPTGTAGGSRFYTDGPFRAVRIERRRQRVAVLALWRWIATLGALIPVALTTVLALLGARPGPERVGQDVAAFWARVPGRELVSGPLDWAASWATWPEALRVLGEWTMGTAAIGLLFWLVAIVGASRWSTWDSSERKAARQLVLGRISRRRPLLEMALLGVVTAILAVLTVAWMWR